MNNGVSERVYLGGGVRVGVCGTVAAKNPVNFRIASMVWASETSEGCRWCGVSKGVGKAPGCVSGRVGGGHYGHGAVVGENSTVFAVRYPRVYVK